MATILIPAYEPSEKLIELVATLSKYEVIHTIVVVNDGSSAEKQVIFNQIRKINKIVLLQHAVNCGKGRTIKTGLRYIQAHLSEKIGIVTVDADGQHLVEDIVKIVSSLVEYPSSFILGMRHFDNKIVPLRSKFGNIITRYIFKLLYKKHLIDTQTGLRGIPISLIDALLLVPYDKYEFELESLIVALKRGYSIHQLAIKTVYFNGNEESHFNPILDSIRIYYVFFRYSIIAFLSFIMDCMIFVFLYYLTASIFFSLVVARIISGSFNFYQNKYRVYLEKSCAALKVEAIQYFILAFAIFFMSYFMIHHLYNYTQMPLMSIKVITDGLLFLLNFITQRLWIFK